MRLSSSRSFFRDPVSYAAAHPGDPVELASPTGRAVLVRSPDEIWRVLVGDADAFRQGKWKRRARRFLGPTLNTLDGVEHRERRLLVQPALDRRRVATFTAAITARAEAVQSGWRPGDRIGLRATLDPLSLAMAAEVLLGVDLGADADPLARALGHVMSRVPRFLPPLPRTTSRKALDDVHAAVRGLLARRRTTERSDDLASLLLADDLPDHVVVGELTAFLLAATDEPPSGLAAVWYHLDRDPDADERLHRELVDVLGGRPFAAGDEERLPYLRAVIDESLRLLPPARYVDRCPVADTAIGGARVRGGTNVLVSPLVTHHDPALYADPAAFDPERWLAPEAVSLPRGAYLPFGAGAHTCIGEPLARLVMTATLATVATSWRLLLDPHAEPPVPGRPDLVATLEPR